jgi:chemotaxis protein MotB
MAEEEKSPEELEEELPEGEEAEEEEPSIPRPPDEVVGTCPACPSMAPAWMATFADMATLLMAFFVLILSFVEMETPSIFKEVSGSMSNSFGVQRDVPSVEPPMAQNIIAQNFKTSKVDPSLITNVQEETSSEEPQDVELKSTSNIGTQTTNSDLEKLEEAFKKEIAKGKVELKTVEGKIVVNVKEKMDSDNETDEDMERSKGQIDEDTLEIYAKVAEAQSYIESEVEVQFNQGDSEARELKRKEKEDRVNDQLKKIRADLKAQIDQGLANVEKKGGQILIQLSAQGSFQSGYARLRTNFLPTLAQVAGTISGAQGKITVSGHTDNIPIAFSERFDSNWDLSAARAAAVADYFMGSAPIDNERINVLGFADTKPVATNDTSQGRSQNRRIEILIDS